jgi:type 1 fimbria pilin
LSPAFGGSVKFPVYMNDIIFAASHTVSTFRVPHDMGPRVLKAAANTPFMEAEAIDCQSQKTVTVNGTSLPGDPNTFKTNLDGLGVRFFASRGWNGALSQAPFSEILEPTPRTEGQFTLRAELVVTGPLSAGALTTLPSMTITFSGRCYPTVSRTQYIKPGDVLRLDSCEVTTQSVQVPLPPVTQRDLPAINATGGDASFSIGLRCPGTVSNLKITLTDASDTANRSTTLGLAPGSSATGVGLQILHGDTLVAYGPDSSRAGNQNQWRAGRANQVVQNIPLQVRYIRTGDTLGAGTVIGKATFTMSYQ